MSLEARILADLKAAMKAGDKARTSCLRMLKADIEDAKLKSGAAELDDAGVIAVLRKAAAQRRDSVAAAEQAGRGEIAAREKAELELIEGYLPAMLGEDEIEAKAKELISELGLESRSDIGRFMKEWMARYRAVSDGKTVQRIAARLLG